MLRRPAPWGDHANLLTKLQAFIAALFVQPTSSTFPVLMQSYLGLLKMEQKARKGKTDPRVVEQAIRAFAAEISVSLGALPDKPVGGAVPGWLDQMMEPRVVEIRRPRRGGTRPRVVKYQARDWMSPGTGRATQSAPLKKSG